MSASRRGSTAWDILRLEDVGAGGDQDGIDAVVLGAAQMQLGEGADLQRLQHDDAETLVLQMPPDAAFVAAGGLDALYALHKRREIGEIKAQERQVASLALEFQRVGVFGQIIGQVGRKVARQIGACALGLGAKAVGLAQCFQVGDRLADGDFPDPRNRSAW